VLSSIAQHFDQPANRLYLLKDQLLKRGDRIVDLVSGNVNDQGIHFPPKIYAAAMASATHASRHYRPDPLGQKPARVAISGYYAREGVKISPDHIILTPGTSISYWYAFKVLADLGDEILCPTPSYPLFDSIARLADVKLVSYRLREALRWEIDFDHLKSAMTPRTKAIVLISPHNPTGGVASAEEIRQLAEIAARKGVAIISDEVFSPFLFQSRRLPRPAETAAPLVLTLNGFSKMLALPGLKIGWMAVTGDPSLVKKTMRALDMISDTFLPVNEAAQFSVPTLLQKSRGFQALFSLEINRRMKQACDLLKEKDDVSFIQPEGGFFMTLRIHGKMDEEEIACQLLQKHRILVHPGYFYDMEGHHLVFSFVIKPSVLSKSLTHLTSHLTPHT